MNRFVTQISAVCLCVAMAPAGHALGKKKKKQSDLKSNPLANVNSRQPDKELFDKAMVALKKGKFDVARLDLQTLLNTYPDTEYAMRAKLAVGDTWYKEGGSAALTQAEQEYKDFETFFPNTPEAAEAQMKVGDIYYQQMAKQDRDPQNVLHAETEYRQMLQQYPDSPLVPRAKQRLRDVQEVLAAREFEIGQFYVGRENWTAAIARLQTVADTYPLFSHSDQTLISLGDAYVTQGQMAERLNLPPKAKAELVKAYNERAVDAYSRVVTRYATAPHVEDAKDRLIAMGRPVPEPTPEQMAESEAEEGSRNTVKLKDRAIMLVKPGPSTVAAVRVGEPSMADPAATTAPQVRERTVSMFNDAIAGKPVQPGPTYGAPAATTTAANPAAGGAAPGSATGAAVEMESVPTSASGTGNETSVEIINPSSNSSAPADNTAAPAANSSPEAPAGTAGEGAGNGTGANTGVPASAAPANAGAAYGLKPVGPDPAATTALPPVDKPAEAPDQVNDVKPGSQPAAQVQTGTAKGKKPKDAPVDHKNESTSQKKKKKGIDKLNPF